MPITVSDLIHSSFRLVGAIAAGETLETAELADAFVSLNQMIASWNTEGASVVGRKRLTVPVYASNGPYALSERPVKIDAASVASGGIDSQLQLVDAAGWETTPEKLMQSVYVRVLYCDYAYPFASVWIAPCPRLGGTLECWIYAVIPQFGTVNDTIDLAPGYEIALRYNFAMVLLPEYPRSQADPSLPAQAQMYKASIAQLNTSNHLRSVAPPAAVPAGTGG